MQIAIRKAHVNDLPAMQQLFVDSITTICQADYDSEQINAWTSSVENKQRWNEKITSQYFLIAESDHKIVGYASLESNDYLDFLYVHKDFQKQGIAGKLYSEIEKEAIKRKAAVLHSDVSKTARRFFEKKGFEIIKPQTKIIKDVEIINFKMTKQL